MVPKIGDVVEIALQHDDSKHTGVVTRIRGYDCRVVRVDSINEWYWVDYARVLGVVGHYTSLNKDTAGKVLTAVRRMIADTEQIITDLDEEKTEMTKGIMDMKVAFDLPVAALTCDLEQPRSLSLEEL